MPKRKKIGPIKERWLAGELEVEQWFERGGAHVGIRDAETGEYLVSWWDDDVFGLVEAGFFKSGRIPFSGVDEESVIDYADYIGVSPYPE